MQDALVIALVRAPALAGVIVHAHVLVLVNVINNLLLQVAVDLDNKNI